MPCPNPLLFDVEVGSCVRSEQLSASAKAGRPPGFELCTGRYKYLATAKAELVFLNV
jgi:hypothetical protein